MIVLNWVAEHPLVTLMCWWMATETVLRVVRAWQGR